MKPTLWGYSASPGTSGVRHEQFVLERTKSLPERATMPEHRKRPSKTNQKYTELLTELTQVEQALLDVCGELLTLKKRVDKLECISKKK